MMKQSACAAIRGGQLLVPRVFARFGLSGARIAWKVCEESLPALPAHLFRKFFIKVDPVQSGTSPMSVGF